MTPWILIPVLLGGGAQRGTERPTPRTRQRPALVHRQIAPDNDRGIALIATPAVITFSATNPDAAGVPGNAVATVTWRANGDRGQPWVFTVRADSASFESCPRVPVSAITVSCSHASVDNGGFGVCSPAAPLAASPRIIAAGSEGSASASYQINLAFTLADSWKYVAQLNPPCSISLSYTAYVP
jgi:hypothetical protein